MPWINQKDCTCCGICVSECPSGAISIINFSAVISMNTCIRCGICHNVCPVDAVRHDSELISVQIDANIELTKKNMAACEKHFDNIDEKKNCLSRMIKFFNREKIIAKKTIEQLKLLEKDI